METLTKTVSRSAAARVDNIVVSERAFGSDDASFLVAECVDFVNALTESGMYLRSELPPNAMRSYHADYYLAQVCNGGHGQFVANSGWQALVISDIAEGLQAMRATPFASIFEALRSLIESDAQRAQAIAASRGFGDKDPAIAELDKQYFAANPYQALVRANADWLRGLPELKVVPNVDHAQAIRALCDANPQRAARLHAHRREAMGRKLLDPLHVAARLLCTKAQCLPLRGIGHGDPSAKAPDGRQGVGWQIQSVTGRQVMFLFEDVAFLCETYLADGRKLTPELIEDQRRKALAGDLAALKNFGTLSQREVARIPAADVSDAIEAAKLMPVVEIAERFMAKLETGETLCDVFAAVRLKSAHWSWLVETSTRICGFCYTDGSMQLFDCEGPTLLARLTDQELQHTLAAGPTGRA